MSSNQDSTANKVKKLLDKCVICDSDLSGHRFVQIAATSATADNKNRVQALFEDFKQRRWKALQGYADFRADQNAVLVYLIVGPHPGGIAILIRDPFELYERVELYLLESLNAEEVRELQSHTAPEQWQRF